MSADGFDVIVIGGGPPGEVAAQTAIAGSDRTAVIVEHELLGGECSFWACMPSKGLIRPVEVLATARAVPGVPDPGPLDVAAVLAHRDEITHHRDDASQVEWATGAGIEVIRGHGRLDGEKRVVVDDSRVLTARVAVILATGTVASVPPVPGLAEAKPWTSRDATNLVEVPRRVFVMGGGVVACEAATWLRGLGAEEVTIAEGGPRLLGKMEPFASELVESAFAADGVRVLTGTKVVSVSRGAVGDVSIGRPRGVEVTVTLDNGETVVADELLVAAGRTPVTAGVGLASVGLPEKGFVAVDDHLTVQGVPGEWLYAVGDVNGRALLTHQGKYQARVVGDVIAARAAGEPLSGRKFSATTDNGQVPQVTFTDPQVGSVGLTLAAAREKGLPVEEVQFDAAALAGTYLDRPDYAGRCNLVIDTARQVVVGATFAGPDIAELIHSATVAVVGEVPLDVLWHAVPAYPTKSELWLRLLETWRG